jgi:hypothetical protein
MKLQAVFCLFLISVYAIVSACSSPESPQGQPMNFPGQPAGSFDGELVFKVPEGWIQESPSSGMRKSQFRLPGADGNDAELAVFVGIGGSVQQNVDRWINQFSNAGGGSVKDLAKIQNRSFNEINTTVVDVSGNFRNSSMGPMGGGSSEVKPNYRMLAAVMETSTGPWFLKLTGPEETIEQWEESFFEYLESVQVQ